MSFFNFRSKKEKISTKDIERKSLINAWDNEDLSKRAAKIDGVNLKNNEFCYFAANEFFKWQEQKSKTVRTNYSSLVSTIRLAKGLNYRNGSIKHSSNKITEWNNVFSGVPFLTNKRIIFVNQNNMKAINLSNIIGMKSFTDGTHLYRDSGKIILLRASDPTEFNIILNRILNNDFEKH